MEERQREENLENHRSRNTEKEKASWTGGSSGRSVAVRKKGSDQRASNAQLFEPRFDSALPLSSWVIWASHLAFLGLSVLFVKWA